MSFIFISTKITPLILNLLLTEYMCAYDLDLDACVQPVLELDEAPKHPHNM